MPPPIADDPGFREVHFLVVDFEATTPAGHPPEPVEVAALGLRHRERSGPQPSGFRWEALMRPPARAPLTPRATAHTGIRPEQLAGEPPAEVVLRRLDEQVPPGPAVLVAHSAPVEAGIVHRYRTACPRLARLPVLDTIRMAKSALPGLSSYGLDALLDHTGLPRPSRRHRAMPDVEATARLFQLLLAELARAAKVRSLTELVSRFALPAEATRPRQLTLDE
ncbi:hypothetical protein GCM10012287_03750 [Streptomyces daqingensis]|uniref:Exonuclease domain-containing protein n=1 Tax=Streptomyces daqingensis TaxID=1472640 RepID=A0ABQ2LTM3_9ACTN|nr:3'-5' exonuclease [Streptomyces daqingensis]GGO42567.1 hypothetical protein GCM10012287_03750 [Streptomyces daqingensis]